MIPVIFCVEEKLRSLFCFGESKLVLTSGCQASCDQVWCCTKKYYLCITKFASSFSFSESPVMSNFYGRERKKKQENSIVRVTLSLFITNFATEVGTCV